MSGIRYLKPSSSLFISSVQKELAEERRAGKAFVERDPLLRRYFTAFLFEDLAATDRRGAHAVYLAEVDRCAVYVGVFGDEDGFEDRELIHLLRRAELVRIIAARCLEPIGCGIEPAGFESAIALRARPGRQPDQLQPERSLRL